MSKHSIANQSVDLTEMDVLVEPESGDVFCIFEFEEEPTIVVRMNRFRFKHFQNKSKAALARLLH
ncbi:MAG: hypothetical protein KF874_14555 [Rhizobiaceae bacterium]|nr:hypothetical protein [Rhizobiaceae bacterium]